MKTEKLSIIKRLSFLIAMILIIISCNTLNQGVIVEKWYELPKIKKLSRNETIYFNKQKYTQNVNYLIKDGQDTQNVNYLIKDGQDFCITIKGLKQNKKEALRTIYLRRECWDSVYVGMQFSLSDKCFTYDFTLDVVPENTLVDKFP